jgi:hypothetical protein
MKFLTALSLLVPAVTAGISTKAPSKVTKTIGSKASSKKAGKKSSIPVNITVTLTTDSFGGETSWSLSHCDGTEVASNSSVLANNQLYEDSFLVDPNLDFEFTIEDSFGDGICCGWGQGSYYITYNDIAVPNSNGDFEGRNQSLFFGASSLENDPLTCQASLRRTTEFQIRGEEETEIYTISLSPTPDDNTSIPNDTPNISVYNLEGSEVVVWSDPNDPALPFFARYLTENVPDGDYTFELTRQTGAARSGLVAIDRGR